jgi:hypothetical protein
MKNEEKIRAEFLLKLSEFISLYFGDGAGKTTPQEELLFKQVAADFNSATSAQSSHFISVLEGLKGEISQGVPQFGMIPKHKVINAIDQAIKKMREG